MHTLLALCVWVAFPRRTCCLSPPAQPMRHTVPPALATATPAGRCVSLCLPPPCPLYALPSMPRPSKPSPHPHLRQPSECPEAPCPHPHPPACSPAASAPEHQGPKPTCARGSQKSVQRHLLALLPVLLPICIAHSGELERAAHRLSKLAENLGYMPVPGEQQVPMQVKETGVESMRHPSLCVLMLHRPSLDWLLCSWLATSFAQQGELTMGLFPASLMHVPPTPPYPGSPSSLDHGHGPCLLKLLQHGA